MASPRTLATATSIIYILTLGLHSADITNREVSSLLSLLNRKIVGNKKPVIIILEKDSGRAVPNKADPLSSSDEHDAINIPHFLHAKLDESKLIKKSTPSYLSMLQQGQKNRQRYRSQKIRENKDKDIDNRILRSSIVKKLLRISNSIQCEAKDSCQDKCQSKHNGKKVLTCQVQCQVKYDCDEAEEKDPCEENDGGCEGENSCGNSQECLMSTKGERLVPEETSCKRC